MRIPPLTDAQRDTLATHARRLEDRRDLSGEAREFLIELRKLMVISDVSHERLAGRIAENARTSGTPQSDTALPGHTREGHYSSSNMSDELLGKGQLPRPPTILAVIELYHEKFAQPTLADLREHLGGLFRAAAKAQTRLADDSEDAAIDSKKRSPGGLTYRNLRAARDQARADAESFRERLEELEAASSVDKDEIDRLTDDGHALQRKIDALKVQVLQRDDQIIARELQVDEQSQQLTGAVARIDQLEAEVSDLNTEVADLRERLGRSWLQRFRQQVSESGDTTPESREQGRHRLHPAGDEDEHEDADDAGPAEESGATEGSTDGAGPAGGNGGVGLRQVTEPVKTRRSRTQRVLLRAAASVLALAGLLTFAATADVWPGAKAINTTFEACVRNHGLAAEAGAVFPRTLFQVLGLAYTPPQSQYYLIQVPSGMSKGSVTFATTAQEAVQKIKDARAFYTYYSIPDRQFTVRSTVVVDPSSDDGTGPMLTGCVLGS